MGPARVGCNDRGGLSLGGAVPDSSVILPERRQESDAFIRCLPEMSGLHHEGNMSDMNHRRSFISQDVHLLMCRFPRGHTRQDLTSPERSEAVSRISLYMSGSTWLLVEKRFSGCSGLAAS